MTPNLYRIQNSNKSESTGLIVMGLYLSADAIQTNLSLLHLGTITPTPKSSSGTNPHVNINQVEPSV